MRCTRRQLVMRAVPLVLLVSIAAGCGGGGSSSATTTTTASPAEQRAAIRQAWTQFFSGKTSADEKIALLQNGKEFAPAIKAQASSPLAKGASAKVEKVTLRGPDRARVVYTVELGGAPVLQHQVGTAVRVGGAWKVGDQSFCGLLHLQGTVPAACSPSG